MRRERSLLPMLLALLAQLAVGGPAFALYCTATAPDADFTEHGDGTVTHSKTGLTWKRCAEGLSGTSCATGMAVTLTWADALKAASSANVGSGFANHKDWRLPNLKELHSILELCRHAPAINNSLFPGAPSAGGPFWSSSSYVADARAAWASDSHDGHQLQNYKTTLNYARLVRGGTGFDSFDRLNPTYSVTYDGNGNTGGQVPTDISAYHAGEAVVVLGNSGGLSKANYSFSGWNNAADGSGEHYDGGDTFTMNTANVRLYAHWTMMLPTVATAAATALGATGATLNGTVSSNGWATTAGFEYGPTLAYGTSVSAAQLGNSASGVAVLAAITGLSCNSRYHFRARAASAAGTSYGNDAVFTTLACSTGPRVTTQPATEIAKTVATLNGSVTDVGRNVTAITYDYGLTLAYGSTAAASLSGFNATPGAPYTVTPTALVVGLACGTAYHFRIRASDATPATAIGGDLSFATSPCANQTITFGAAPNIAVGGTGMVSATATSGLAVTITSLTPMTCTVSGRTVTGVMAGTCTVAANQSGDNAYNPAPEVTQSFGIAGLPTLTVVPRGTGIGHVSSNPVGISCGDDCSEIYASGTPVTLNATTPFPYAAFAGWGGDCFGVGSCNVTMSSSRNVIARFLYTGSEYSYNYVQEAYVAYYGRPADPQGQGYWAGQMDIQGQSLAAIIGAFGNSDEFRRRYGGLTNPQLVTKIYQQALGRDPEPEGLAWYVAELEAGRRTLQTITLDVLNGATGEDATTVSNKLNVGAYYSAKVAEGCPYGAEQDGVTLISNVGANPASVTAAKAAIDARCAR